ncbi:MAG: hypothetical protein PHF99_12310 [Bacteroidales bacterium]|nr:hypothetical protein [Bacteroidales bacterium]
MATTKPKVEKDKNSTSEEEVKKENPISVEQLIQGLFKGIGKDSTDETKKEFYSLLSSYLLQVAKEFKVYDKYNILILYDDSTLIKSDADKIYNAITKFTEKKPLLLILLSRGGEAGSAYLIGKLCREYSNGNFFVAIPRYAKSAATLLACAADEIHMGSMSELGPVDPQINKMPALGLKNSVEHIAALVKKYPDASDMFAKYLHLSIEPIQMGYYERVAESAMQYAENLLSTHQDNIPRSAKEIAEELVYKYKDHGFVIDFVEATKIFGSKVIKRNTDEYLFSNAIYKVLDLVENFSSYLNNTFYFIGSIGSEPNFIKREK